jgi:hypothetical protein
MRKKESRVKNQETKGRIKNIRAFVAKKTVKIISVKICVPIATGSGK